LKPVYRIGSRLIDNILCTYTLERRTVLDINLYDIIICTLPGPSGKTRMFRYIVAWVKRSLMDKQPRKKRPRVRKQRHQLFCRLRVSFRYIQYKICGLLCVCVHEWVGMCVCVCVYCTEKLLAMNPSIMVQHHP